MKEEAMGSVPVGTNAPEEEIEPVEQEAGSETEQPDMTSIQKELEQYKANSAKFEKMVNDSQRMIQRQASEIGELRKSVQQPKKDEGPAVPDQINKILTDIENGDRDMGDGIREVLKLNSDLTASQIMKQFNELRENERVDEITRKFHEANPGFKDASESGALDQYMKDPLIDEITAFKMYERDQQIEALKNEYEAKVQAAKDEGAKLAQGAKNANDVLGKKGSSARDAAAKPKVWKNTQEATDAMLAKLKEIRAASG